MALSTITPVARLELFLQDIADGNETPSETPVSRPEEFLRRIAKSNGEQDAALEHISDQIPIDPTSEDVGKVMTVIEDTSGEEPVYYWAPAEIDSGAYAFRQVSTLTSATDSIGTVSLPEGLGAVIREEVFTPHSDLVSVFNVVNKHFNATANGIQFYPFQSYIDESSTTLDMYAYVSMMATVSGNDIPVVVRVSFRINKTGANIITGGNLMFYNAIGESSITRSNVTAIQKIRIELAVK